MNKNILIYTLIGTALIVSEAILFSHGFFSAKKDNKLSTPLESAGPIATPSPVPTPLPTSAPQISS